jgi:hypothetical protein
LLPRREGDLVCLQAARGRVLIGKMNSFLKNTPPAPALAGYALSCRDQDAFLARCRRAGLAVSGQVVSLPPALGGRWLIEGEAA